MKKPKKNNPPVSTAITTIKGTSLVSQKAEELQNLGYDRTNIDGVLIFYNITMDEATELVHKYNWKASYGIRSKHEC